MHEAKRRAKYFIDRPVQGDLLIRAARYWVASLLLVAGLTLLGWIFVWPGIPSVVADWELLFPLFKVLAVGLMVTVLLLPIVLYDLSRLSNRFAGPVYRLQRSLNDLADGKPVRPVRFRDDDYWHDLAEAFNRVLESRQNSPLDQTFQDAAEPREPARETDDELQPV